MPRSTKIWPPGEDPIRQLVEHLYHRGSPTLEWVVRHEEYRHDAAQRAWVISNDPEAMVDLLSILATADLVPDRAIRDAIVARETTLRLCGAGGLAVRRPGYGPEQLAAMMIRAVVPTVPKLAEIVAGIRRVRDEVAHRQ